MRPLTTFLLLIALGGSAGAQDSLFDDPAALETEAAPEVAGQGARFLESDTRVGGRFWSSFQSSWVSPQGPTWEGELVTDLGADLTLDARPSQDVRVFGKARVTYPFDQSQVRELFTDFTWGSAVLVRVGKQSMKAGVGTFFSPADSLSLEAVDPQDPNADRVGPTAIKARASWGTTNLTAVLVTEGAHAPDQVGGWTQVEAVWDVWEAGLAGFYRESEGWRGSTTLTGSWAGVQLFNEVVVIGDAPKTFAKPVAGVPGGYVLEHRPLVVSWTSGFRATYEELNLTWTAQLYENGLGSDESPTLARTLVRQKVLAAEDLADWGRHQAASSVSLGDVADTGVDLGVLWTANLADGSGRLRPRLSWSAPGDPVTLEVALPWFYGSQGADLAPDGSRWGLSLTIQLGNGLF